MKRRLLVLGLMALITVAAVRWLRSQPESVAGTGELYGHLWCMGIELDSGRAYPAHDWPSGFTVETVPGDDPTVVLKDANGEIVFREGDRVQVDARLHHAEGGDTACAHLDSFEVLAVQPAGS